MLTSSMNHLLILVYFMVSCGSVVGNFFAAAPNEFRPGWPLNISITAHLNAGGEVFVTAYLGPVDDDVYVYGGVSGSVVPGETKILTITVPERTVAYPTQAQLQVTTTGGFTFSSKKYLTYNPKSSLVFVETDKAIYKPGQKVHIRVVHVDKDLKPIIKPLTVVIVNPKDSKLEEYKDIASRTGVTEMTFQLLQSASLGKWQIQVTDDADMSYMKEFTVEEYVLPKFSVEVKSDPGYIIIHNSNTSPVVTVDALYTYGKPVQGRCTLILSYKQIRGTPIYIQSTKQMSPEGKAEFSDLEWKKILDAYNDWEQTVVVTASVTDETGRTAVGQTNVMIYLVNAKVQLLPKSTSVFRADLPAELFIRVSDQAGNPLPNSVIIIDINISSMKPVYTNLTIPNGQTDVSYKFIPELSPDNQQSYHYWGSVGTVRVSLMSDSRVATSGPGYLYQTEYGSVISVLPITDKIPQVGERVEYKIVTNSKELQNTVSYMVISQGSIVEAGSIVSDTFSIIPTMEMCPLAKLFVYMISGGQDTELVVDTIDLSPTRCFAKEVDVSFDAAELRSGVDTTMKVQVNRLDGSNAMPGDHSVYYLGVDKSLVLLQGRTDLNKEEVLSGLSNFSLKSSSSKMDDNYVPHSADKIIQVLGLTTFTTATIKRDSSYHIRFYNMPIPDNRQHIMNMEPAVKSYGKDNAEPKQEVKQKEPVIGKVRKHFPETWLWGQGKTDINGHLKQSVTLPDTITTWLVSAFAVNDEGLAVGSNPFQLAAVQIFFLTMNLPYSIKRGEVFVLRVTLFNYRKQDVNAVIKLANQTTQFSVLDDRQESNGWIVRDVNVTANRASSVEFKIKATSVGLIDLHVIAEDLDDGTKDEVKQKLLVKPEGEMRSRAITKVLVLNTGTEISDTFILDWPENKIVPDSRRVEVKVTGTILGQSLSNLKHLVVVPYGCGEQNMISTVPNIYGLTYIQSRDESRDFDMERDMIDNMKTGYQRQVDMYRHSDGSYSAWGEKQTQKTSGSTWLTAFVLKSFSQAAKFITVDSQVLLSAAKFLTGKQQRSGIFVETGQVFHNAMQSTTGSGPSLTVYTLISLLEAKQAVGGKLLDLNKQIDLAVTYIKSNLSSTYLRETKSQFLAAMSAYALSLVDDDNASLLMDEFLHVVTDLGAPWEGGSASQKKKQVATSYRVTTSSSGDIEIAAYYLLALTHSRHIAEGFQVVKWLQSQQNSNGGYYSTQDTVMALQALSEFGVVHKESLPVDFVNVQEPGSGQSFNVSIGGSRSVLLHTVELPANATTVQVTASGTVGSSCIVKVVYTYYTLAGDDDMAQPEPEVSVVTKTSKVSETIRKVEACVKSSKSLKYKGMFVTTLNLPSGEVALDDPSTILANNPQANWVESEEGILHFYMNTAPGDGYCLYAQVERQMEFEVQKPGSAKIYAYYQPDTAQEVALSLECVNGGDCDSDGAVLINMSNVLLTILICTLVSLLTCM